MSLTGGVPSFPGMTGTHKDTTLTRRSAIVATGGTAPSGAPSASASSTDASS